MNQITSQELEKHANQIEVTAATSQLLAYLSLNGNMSALNPGRYHFLGDLIQKQPRFLKKLLADEMSAVPGEWRHVREENQTNVRFLHGMAIFYREQALRENGDAQKNYWPLSTSLWMLLLCTAEFWDYFSYNRNTNRDSGERLSLKLEEQQELVTEWMHGMLSLHGSLGSRKFAAREHEAAYIHLHCLELCRQGETALREILKQYTFPFQLKPVEEKLVQIKTAATEMLDDIGNGVVREAIKIVDDAEAIKRLPEGIRKNYQGGIQHLEAFINLNIPISRVLRQSLEWYNDWCYDLYVTQQLKEVGKLMKPAGAVANQLIPLCAKSRITPENTALSQHFLFRGFTITAADPQQATREYEEALEWNMANDNAKQLLGEAHHALIMKQINRAVDHVERREFQPAYEVLDAVERQLASEDATGHKQIKEARALVCFRHAESLANEGKFRESLQRSRQAQQLVPNQPAIVQMVKEMEEYAPEEDNLRNLKNAQDALNRGNHEQTVQYAAKVSSKSKFYQNACRIQSGACFHWAIDLANKQQRFAEALEKMERALELNDNLQERKIIEQQRDLLKQAQLGQELKQACDGKNWAKAEQILRHEMAKRQSKEYDWFLRQQLAMVLNAHAVEILNGIQQSEKKFADTVTDIMNSVRQQPGVN